MSNEPRYVFFDEENYVVFDDGRVFKRLDPPVSTDGYKFVRIGSKVYPLQRVIALAFIPNPENKPEVNHIDGDKTNNAVSNLEWVTKSENIMHALKTGLFKNKKPHKRLDCINLKILRIRADLTQAEAAEVAGVSQSVVSDWENGKYKPSPAAREKLAEAYGVSLAEIVKAVEAGDQ